MANLNASVRGLVVTLALGFLLAPSVGRAAFSCDFLFQPDEVLQSRVAYFRRPAPMGPQDVETANVEIYPSRVKIADQEFPIVGVRRMISVADSNMVVLVGPEPTILQRNPYTGKWRNATRSTSFVGDVGLIWFADFPFQVTRDVRVYERILRVTDKGIVDVGVFEFEPPKLSWWAREIRGGYQISGFAVNFQNDAVTIHTVQDGSYRLKLYPPFTKQDRAYISSGMNQAQ